MLRFDLVVSAPWQPFTLEVEALDTAGLVVFRGTDTVQVAPGRTTTRGSPTLYYVAPDTSVVSLLLSPADTTLDAHDNFRFTALGYTADGTRVTALNLGWLSRDPLAATVESDGTIDASHLERTTWIVARTFSGAIDSAHVHVRGKPVAVLVSPDSVVMRTGETLVLYAEARDAAGTPLADPRDLGWSTTDDKIISLSTGGTAARADLRIPPTAGRLLLDPSSGSPRPHESTGQEGIRSALVTAIAPGVAWVIVRAGSGADTAVIRIDTASVALTRASASP